MLIGLQDYIVQETTKEWVLYHNDFSLCSRKVRICLYECGLEFESNHIDLIETGKYEVASKKFLHINPNATVPVLLNKGRPIYESHEQIKFIVNSVDSELNAPADIEAIDYWMEKASMVGNPIEGQNIYAGNTVGPLTFPLFATMLRNVSFLEILKGLISHPMKERVIIFLLLKSLGFKVFKIKLIKKLLENSLLILDSHLLELEKHLSKNDEAWLVGNRFSLADISWSVLLHRLTECNWDIILFKGKPNVQKYFQKLIQRESFVQGISERKNINLEKGKKDLKKSLKEDQLLQNIFNQLNKKVNGKR